MPNPLEQLAQRPAVPQPQQNATASMIDKILALYDSMRGKRTTDIMLPNESGQVDSRLSDPAFMIQDIANNPALRALRDYGQAAAQQK